MPDRRRLGSRGDRRGRQRQELTADHEPGKDRGATSRCGAPIVGGSEPLFLSGGLGLREGIDMKRRLLELLGVATVLAIVTASLQFVAVPVSGQAPSATAWGHPNLEGIWLDVWSTPLERAPEIGEREFATEEERAARNQIQLDRPPVLPSGAYNTVYTSAKPAGPRTSLVVDPPNGRIPALTAEAVRRNEIEQEWRAMLLRNTETCRNQAPQCAGGEVRAPVAPPLRHDALLQHAGPHEPPRRPGGSEPR